MSSEIDYEKIESVLLADTWIKVQPGSFDVVVDSDTDGFAEPGFTFIQAGFSWRIHGPIRSIQAVRTRR